MSPHLLQLLGLGLNVIGTALIFLYAYPPADQARREQYVGFTRIAVLLVFMGFVVQFAGALQDWLH
jgi:hypothetical protein